jgi:phosphinothricin acetyltransferase
MDMKIRVATPKDAEALLGIYAYYVKETAITFEYDVPTVEEFRGRIENTLKKYPYLVAEEEGKIVGYAYASAFKTRAAYDHSVETSIYVAKDCRRAGLGSFLLENLEKNLGKMNILNVNACISVPDGEEDEHLTFGSVRFHEKNGYKLVGTFHECGYKFGRWYNMVWMEKMLGEHVSPAPDVIPFPNLNLWGRG